MSDFLELLEWLSVDQALKWIANGTGSSLSYETFYGLCASGKFHAYVAIEDLDFTGYPAPRVALVSTNKTMVRIVSFSWGSKHKDSDLLDYLTITDFNHDGEEQCVQVSDIAPSFKPFEIKDFIESLTTTAEAPPAEKPLEPRERASVAKIISVLAAAADIDLSQPHKAEATFSALAANLGLEAPSTATTVKFFKMASEHAKENQP
ncbi:hypothetical protein [Atopomonas sediminilitoris]|uniref:hypothetical protein n=1 Tax=Atopomonas sediminilitoris TaxID=2919919 RepID=UPI001F4F056C|nr:hypothetical protein [Atopomonas sediminilitoris]MCJ8168723.1 hypothetical protein [Atopomonas sediminilitoris]